MGRGLLPGGERTDEMRRFLMGLAMAALTVLTFAAPAGAATGQVTHYRFTGTFAYGEWYTSSATSSTNTFINISKSAQGLQLFAGQYTGYWDANGNFTGATQTIVDVTGGFSFALQQPLASASLSGSGLRATTYTYDANSNQTGSSITAIDVNVAWTGQGPITRGASNSHSTSDGYSVISHSNGTNRAATATGTFSGVTLSAADPVEAALGSTNTGYITICVGNSC